MALGRTGQKLSDEFSRFRTKPGLDLLTGSSLNLEVIETERREPFTLSPRSPHHGATEVEGVDDGRR